MPRGVIAEVVDGVATVEFADADARVQALTRLLDVGGPESIQVDTRSGRRRKYVVAEGHARAAGLLDGPPSSVSPHGDSGYAAALAAAHEDAKAVTGPAQPTSRNTYSGQTPAEVALAGGHIPTAAPPGPARSRRGKMATQRDKPEESAE